MPKMPKRVKVGPLTYRIASDTLTHTLAEHDSKQALMGRCDTEELLIVVSPKLAEGQKRSTLVHELLHALRSASGYDVQADDGADREERIVSAFEAPLLCLLRDNPALVAWLLAD